MTVAQRRLVFGEADRPVIVAEFLFRELQVLKKPRQHHGEGGRIGELHVRQALRRRDGVERAFRQSGVALGQHALERGKVHQWKDAGLLAIGKLSLDPIGEHPRNARRQPSAQHTHRVERVDAIPLLCVFVHMGSGLAKPADLAGKCVGVPVFDMATAVWLRGIFDEHRHGGLLRASERAQ